MSTTVYRVEKPGSDKGLWYTLERKLEPQVFFLGLGCANLPMAPDPEYRKDGIDWFSGCSSLEDIFKWFSPREIAMLTEEKGFRLMRFESALVRDYGGHQVFSKGHMLAEPVVLA